MNKIKLKLLTSIAILAVISPFARAEVLTGKQAITTLYKSIASDQTSITNLHEQYGTDLLEQEALIRSDPGLFSSYVHFNINEENAPFIHPSLLIPILRDHLKIYDSNFFVTSWIVENLLEAQKLAPKTFPVASSLLVNAVTALNKFQDKNHPDSDAISFWPQKFDSRQNTWMAYPTNLMAILGKSSNFFSWGLGVCLKILPISTCMHVSNMIPRISDALAIPSDNDDSSLNLTMGASLEQQAKSGSQKAWILWREANSNEKIANYLRLLLKHIYEASSTNHDKNMIDPRSYYFMRNAPQLDTAQYVTTWIDSISDEEKLVTNKAHTMPKVAMPFNVNNVDANVNANVLYALAKLSTQDGELSSALSNLTTQETAQLKNLETSIADLLTWIGINNLAFDRPDVVTIYYPAKYNFIWFASKTDSYLRQKGSALPAHWQSIQSQLHAMLTNQGTATILKMAQHNDHLTFWDDFLGDADVNQLTHHIQADDRLYSTAVNANALINIWANASTAGGGLHWAADTPPQVKQDVLQAGTFLTLFSNIPWYRHENVFFSGSVKSFTSMPSAYFGNNDHYLDGNAYVKDEDLLGLRVYGVAGRADSDSYSQWLAAHPKNSVFQSFNADFPFPYWSAPSLTNSTILLALAKITVLSH
jgi:hypothetical protein